MRWCILKFVYENKTIFKLFRGFYGGYLDGDGWRLNSGINSIACEYIQDEPAYIVHGYSGSQYMVHPSDEGLSSYMKEKFYQWRNEYKDVAEIDISSVEEVFDAQD